MRLHKCSQAVPCPFFVTTTNELSYSTKSPVPIYTARTVNRAMHKILLQRVCSVNQLSL